MTVAAGQRLGPYEILSPIGAGGMGEVYRARDARLGREVAVKVLPAHLSSAADALARFEREARVVAALSHPNILAIHDYGREGSVSYAVMELLQGETLRDRLVDSAVPPRKAVEYTQQIARGLAAAHDRGIVHRDLKPENVFLTKDGIVKILDFGLASPTSKPAAEPAISKGVVTETGTVVGTPGYMSPEQIRGKEVDARCDIFALGAIFFEMLTGRRAFSKGSPVETMMAVLQDDPGHGESGRAVPAVLAPVLAHCLEKNPEDRFQSARDLVFALQVVERDVDSASRGAPSGAFGSSEAASIAVLPFRNMSADPTAAYFSDGMTEEIINALTKIETLRVAARTSSFAFRGKDVDVRQIGRELGVRTVLEGSVRQAGQRLRITAQLIDVSNGYHLWSERYDREMQDVFAVQDEIARTIVAKLSPKLLGVSEEPLIEAPTSDVAAYDLYLKGRFLWNVRRPEGRDRAVRGGDRPRPLLCRRASRHRGLLQRVGVLRRDPDLGGVRAGARRRGEGAGAQARLARAAPLARHHRALLRVGHRARGARAAPRRPGQSARLRRLLLADAVPLSVQRVGGGSRGRAQVGRARASLRQRADRARLGLRRRAGVSPRRCPTSRRPSRSRRRPSSRCGASATRSTSSAGSTRRSRRSRASCR